jgi:hypothetical protein
VFRDFVDPNQREDSIHEIKRTARNEANDRVEGATRANMQLITRLLKFDLLKMHKRANYLSNFR